MEILTTKLSEASRSKKTNSTYMRSLKSVKFIAIEQMVGIRGWDQGWDSVFNGLFGKTGRF